MNYKKKKAYTALLAVVLAVGVLIALFAAAPAKVDAADWKTAEAAPDTLAHWSYTFGLGGTTDLPASSENIGRIWVDKSVFTGDATVPLGNTPVPKTEGADFLVGLSALSSASSELKTTSAPLDIVMVLDVSGSMSGALTNGQ